MAPVRLVTVACLACSLVLPHLAAAQRVATSYQELTLLVGPGDAITVTDTTGRKVSGRIAELSPTVLAMKVDGRPREWREDDVASISHLYRDPLGNGALIGLGVGVTWAAVGLAVLAGDDEGLTVAEGAIILGLYGAIGAGIGTGIDALIRRDRVIFERRAGRVSIGVAPQFGPARAGGRITIGF